MSRAAGDIWSRATEWVEHSKEELFCLCSACPRPCDRKPPCCVWPPGPYPGQKVVCPGLLSAYPGWVAFLGFFFGAIEAMASKNTSAVTAASRGGNSAVTVAEVHEATSKVFATEITRSKMIGRRDTLLHATNSPSHPRALKHTRFRMIRLIRRFRSLLFCRSVRTRAKSHNPKRKTSLLELSSPE